MKKTLFIIAILLALGLAGCSDSKDNKELKTPTIPPTETVAVGVRDHKSAPEANVSTELYSDGDYTITRSGDAVFCKKDKKRRESSFPRAHHTPTPM